MKISEAGARALGKEEGLRLKAYKDTVGVWTIGYGHTGRMSPPKVTAGMTITERQAVEFLKADLAPTEAAVNGKVKVPITQSMYDALVSFTFNVGVGAFGKSTLLRRLNAGDYEAAADQFLVWVKQPELKGRRKRERALFLRDGIPGASQRLPGIAEQPAPRKPPAATPAPTRPAGWHGGHYYVAPHALPPFYRGSDGQLAAVQRRLDELGFHGVGRVDGKWGTKTIGTLAEFRAVGGLPVATKADEELGRIDKATFDLLQSPAAPRAPISKERQEAGTKDVVEDAPTSIVPSLWQRLWGKVQGIGGGGVGILATIGYAFGGDDLDRVLGLPPWLLGLLIVCGSLVGIVGLVTWLLARAQVRGTVDAYRVGKVV